MEDIDIEELKAKIKPLADERKSLEGQLERLQAETETTTQDEVLDVAGMFELALKQNDTFKVNRIIHELIDQIVIDGEDIEIHWNF